MHTNFRCRREFEEDEEKALYEWAWRAHAPLRNHKAGQRHQRKMWSGEKKMIQRNRRNTLNSLCMNWIYSIEWRQRTSKATHLFLAPFYLCSLATLYLHILFTLKSENWKVRVQSECVISLNEMCYRKRRMPVYRERKWERHNFNSSFVHASSKSVWNFGHDFIARDSIF